MRSYFKDPTKQGIRLAIDECGRNAEFMMGDRAKDITDHHRHEMMKLVQKLLDQLGAVAKRRNFK